MLVFQISLELEEPRSEYSRLIETIESLGEAQQSQHWLESVWVVRTELSAIQVRNRLKGLIGPRDKMIVSELTGDWATFNISSECTKWLEPSPW